MVLQDKYSLKFKSKYVEVNEKKIDINIDFNKKKK